MIYIRKALDYYGNVLSEKDRIILTEYPLRRIMQLTMEESNQSECGTKNSQSECGTKNSQSECVTKESQSGYVTNDDSVEESSSDDEPPTKRVTKTTRKVLEDDEKEAIRLQRQAEREGCYAVARRHLQEGEFDG